jgi:hypothetical protein
MSTEIYYMIVSFVKMGAMKGSLYEGLMVNLCWFCQTSMKYSKRYAQNAVEHL